jgi:tetratricopeptide (TPR) repeat protein
MECNATRRQQSRIGERVARAIVLGLLVAAWGVLCPATQAGRLSGKVLDPDGKPLDGLELRFVPDSEDAQEVPPVTTKKGKFSVGSFPRGSYRVELSGAEWVVRRMELAIRDAQGGELGEMETEIPPGTLPPSFEVRSSQRAYLKLHVAPPESGEQVGAAVNVAQAVASSEELKELNRLLELGEFEDLLAAADAVLAKEPDLGGAIYLRGVALWRLGRNDESAAALELAVEAAPDQSGVRGVLGQLLLEEAETALQDGDEERARETFGRAAEQFAAELVVSPGESVWLHNQAIALDQSGQLEPAIEALAALLEVEPSNRIARLRMGVLLSDVGRYDEALRTLESVPEPGEDVVVAMANVSVTLYNDDRLDEAVSSARRAVEIGPGVAFAHTVLGRALLAKGEFDAAAAELEESLRLAPDDPEAEGTRAILEAMAARK